MQISQLRHKWFSIPVELTGIKDFYEFVPVSAHVNFTKIVERLGEDGIVDERTIRLYRIDSDNREIDEPFQFIPDNEPQHTQRHLNLETSDSVSWIAEWNSDRQPQSPHVKGTVSWIGRGISRYSLIFAVPFDSTAVQVPFPPENLRHFDPEGKPTPVHWFPIMQIKPQYPLNGFVNIYDVESLVTSYMVSGVRRSYFYPVNGPDGIGLTELGKPHDPTGSHAHHYSLWVAHANIGGSDFWSERGGIISHKQFDEMEDGALFARLVQKNDWAVNDIVLLKERRNITIYATPDDFRLIDIELDFSTGGQEPVEIGKTPFGFLAARVAQSMTVFDGGGEILNSLGQRNEQKAHWQNASWIDQSGPIAAGKWGGIALFDHPDNPGYPNAWHCRNDGWAGASFNLNKSWILEPGDNMILKYRIHLHRHNAEEGEVERRYEEYISSPIIKFGIPHIISDN